MKRLDPTDVRSYPDVIRALIESRTGTRLPDLRPQHSLAPTPRSHLARTGDTGDTGEGGEGAPAPEPVGTVSYPSPVGDLSGDGLDDVLVYDIQLPAERLSLRALRGTDGQELWQASFGAGVDAIAETVGDLTGDGKEELLVEELEITDSVFDSNCDDSGCTFNDDETYDWHVSMRSGATGKSLWSKRYDGSYTDRFGVSGESPTPVSVVSTATEDFQSSNVVVLPEVAGDHDGDGHPDVLVDELDVGWHAADRYEETAIVTSKDNGEESLRTATRSTLLDGSRGQIIVGRSFDTAPRIGLAWPVSDLAGTTTPDVLWDGINVPDTSYSCTTIAVKEDCTSTGAGPTLDAEALDGATLATTWHVGGAVSDAYTVPVEADLSGDGVEDFLVELAQDGQTYGLRLLSGVDGTELWNRSTATAEYLVLVDDIGGSPGADLAVVSLADAPGAYAIRFTRLDGRTGQPFLDTVREFPILDGSHDDEFVFLYAGGMDDVDGDRIGDLFSGAVNAAYDYNEETGEATLADVSSASVVESSATGTTVRESRTKDTRLLWPSVDLSDDGNAEMFETRCPGLESGPCDISTLSLTPQKTLWTRTFAPDEGFSIDAAGDEDGKPGNEALFGRITTTGNHVVSSVASLTGATGAVRWQRQR
ncbi:MAG: hypothetical protein ABR600_04775 [Actinomycetota bacterium]|nr:hypothetical protein [Actinomycetota bacterium]